MRPNLGRVGRDHGQLGQCPNSRRLLVLKASLVNLKDLLHQFSREKHYF